MAYAFTVEPGASVRLKDYDPDERGGLDKAAGQARLAELNDQLSAIQETLYAAGTHNVLLVLQGMDTSGKDGTIRNVFKNVNPQGCRIESFKVPTSDELAHDFLWRVHQAVPPKGLIGVFNRSHYEDVLAVRVHELVPKNVWKARYGQINNFEQLLTETNTVVIKCFLHISKDEQEKRLTAREQDVSKAWKLSAGDWRERAYWDAYMSAYEDALGKCSTAAAPWHVIPANRKWYRNLAIAELLVGRLSSYHKDWEATLSEMSTARLAELKEYRAQTPS